VRVLVALALVACTKSAPEPHTPAPVATPAAAHSGSGPATAEQCEKVLDRFAELEVKREPEGDIDATAAKKANRRAQPCPSCTATLDIDRLTHCTIHDHGPLLFVFHL